MIYNYFDNIKEINKIRDIVLNIQKVKVFREKNYQDYEEVDSTELVPGDIFAINSNMKLPCDCVLISGEILLNEVSLTGEFTPIPKTPLENND